MLGGAGPQRFWGSMPMEVFISSFSGVIVVAVCAVTCLCSTPGMLVACWLEPQLEGQPYMGINRARTMAQRCMALPDKKTGG